MSGSVGNVLLSAGLSRAAGIALVLGALGCSSSGTDTTASDTGTADTAVIAADTGSAADSAASTDTGTPADTASGGDTASSLDCRSPGGPKCKSGTVCVPRVDATGALLGGYACELPDGALGHGCTGCLGGKQNCSAGECWQETSSGVSLCAKGCTTNADCTGSVTGCCKKSPDAKCSNASCVGGSPCTKLGFCAPC